MTQMLDRLTLLGVSTFLNRATADRIGDPSNRAILTRVNEQYYFLLRVDMPQKDNIWTVSVSDSTVNDWLIGSATQTEITFLTDFQYVVGDNFLRWAYRHQKLGELKHPDVLYKAIKRTYADLQ